MNDPKSGPLESTQQTLMEHLEAALEGAEDEDAVFHLRHAKQLALDMPAVVEMQAERSEDAEAESGV